MRNLNKKKYLQTCRELELIGDRITELPQGDLYPEKHGKYVEYYHQWYEGGKQRKYVKKSDVEDMRAKIELRKQLEEKQKQLMGTKEYYQQLLIEEKQDPEQLWADVQAKRESMKQHRLQRKEAIEKDSYHSNTHVTLNGEFVRSKGEVILANLLYFNGIHYEYEKEQWIGGEWIKPDFIIYYKGRVIYWEHVGLLSDAKYRKRWEAKREAYARAGIVEGVNLIITYGHDGIDSIELQNLIDMYILQ